MCSQSDFPPYDDPSQFVAPTPTRPRRYRLSGTPISDAIERADAKDRGSIALAILGEMLNEAEVQITQDPRNQGNWIARDVLYLARARVEAAGG